MRATIAILAVALVGAPGAARAAPANDDFADAEPTGIPPYQSTISTADSSLENGEPQPCGAIGSSVWYRFTPEQSAYYGANTTGSDFDTVIAVYTGSSLEDLSLVECNDEGYEPPAAYVEFLGSAGVTYYIQAGGVLGAQGTLDFALSWESGALDPGAIAGTVTNEAGEPLSGVCVEARSPEFEVMGTGLTDEAGMYFIGALEWGFDFYRVFFSPCFEPALAYGEEWYDDRPDFESADPVTVVSGETTSGIDAILEPPPPPPLPPDLAVTALRVQDRPIGTDEYSTGIGWSRLIHVEIQNLGRSTATDSGLWVDACPATVGTCQGIGFLSFELDPGEGLRHTFTWNGLWPDPMIGDVVIVARARTADDVNLDNDTRSVLHHVLVGGTGFGVGPV